MRARIPSALAAAVFLLWAPLAGATDETVGERRGPRTNEFGRFSLGISGGFQHWSLSGLEESLEARAEQFAIDGFNLKPGSFDLTYAYGLDLQYRLNQGWFTRVNFEWTRLAFDDRDRAFFSALGSITRTAVSVSYTARVQTKPVFVAFGGGRSFERRSVRWGWSGSLLVAPVKIEDELTLFIDSETTTKVQSTGTGFGFETALSVDYFTQTRSTLFVEAFLRRGSTQVELDDTVWESSIIPGKRRIDFGGGGIRFGMRWI